MEWRQIPGYEGYYEISDQGLVRSMERTVPGKAGRMDTRRAQDKKVFVAKSTGYLVVNLSKEGINKTHLIHRLLGATFLPNPDGLPEIDHLDRNKQNNALSNLRWCDRKTNLKNRKESEKPIGISEERYIILTKENHYQVRINSKTCLGTFKTMDEAILERDFYLTVRAFVD